MSEISERKPKTVIRTIASSVFFYKNGLNRRNSNKDIHLNNKMVLTESLIEHCNEAKCNDFNNTKEALQFQMQYWDNLNIKMNCQRTFMKSRLEEKQSTILKEIIYREINNIANILTRCFVGDNATLSEVQGRVSYARSIVETINRSALQKFKSNQKH